MIRKCSKCGCRTWVHSFSGYEVVTINNNGDYEQTSKRGTDDSVTTCSECEKEFDESEDL